MKGEGTTQLHAHLAQALPPLEEEKLPGGGYSIYGAGNTAALYEPCFKAEGLLPAYFIDNAPAKQGTLFQGAPVIDLEQAREKCRGHLILISSCNYSVCGSIFDTLRCSPIEGAAVMTVDEFVFRRHREEILQVFDWLEDDISRQTYVNMILARMHREKQRADLTVPDQYFGLPPFRRRDGHEVFVDCGAYVGDTLEEYLQIKAGEFGEVYAFEPECRNFAAMQARAERLEREWAIAPQRIHLVPAGVGETDAQLAMRNTNQDTASLGSGFVLTRGTDAEDTIPVVALDQYFADKPISFLKADIESFEYPMLCGAEGVIRRDKPKIAVCTYHNPCDMFRLAHKLKQLIPDYHLAVRQHYCDLCETILYAWK